MMTREELRVMREIVDREEGILDLMKEYKEYKKLDTPRGYDKMEESHVVDDYNLFMDEAEKILFSDKTIKMAKTTSEIVIPEPSDALKKFKDRFNKFF